MRLVGPIGFRGVNEIVSRAHRRVLAASLGTAVILSILFGAGCSTAPVKSLFATSIDAEVVTSPDVNPDSSGRASPIVVRVYELKSPGAFEAAEFFALYKQETAVLGNDVLARDEFEFTPDQHRKVERKTHIEARYVAVVAAYKNIDDARWRAVLELQQNKTNALKIEIGRQSVAITTK